MTQSQALQVLKTGVNVFLTGDPGSGKTHTVGEYVDYLKDHKVPVAVTASTGIAATHLGGRTIHSWSGIGISTSLNEKDIRAIAKKPYVARSVKKASVLIIDEVSMLSPEAFAMVEAVCRAARDDQRPFGGMQVVVVGDFFQLPPVRSGAKEQRGQAQMLSGSEARFAYGSTVWERADFRVCYLTEQYRHDDPDLLEVLSAIRSNAFGQIHLRHIERRRITDGYAPDDVPKLFSRNINVDRVNEDKLRRLSGEKKEFSMSTEGEKKQIASLKKGCLSPEILRLKEGAVVMCTKNNSRAGFVNGTLGTVERFAADTGYPIVRTRDNMEVYMEPMEWALEEDGKIRARIRQIPLRLAWAMTIHKSQGASLDEAVMDLSNVFEHGQGYVALSRVRRLSGLHIHDWNKRAFEVSDEVREKDRDFRLASKKLVARLVQGSDAEIKGLQRAFIQRSGGTQVE